MTSPDFEIKLARTRLRNKPAVVALGRLVAGPWVVAYSDIVVSHRDLQMALAVLNDRVRYEQRLVYIRDERVEQSLVVVADCLDLGSRAHDEAERVFEDYCFDLLDPTVPPEMPLETI